MNKKDIALHIPVGSYCNNDCRFCMEPRIDKKVNLNKKFIFGMLDKYKFEKAERVLFTNKEPTLNPNLIDYIKYAKKIGYKNIALVTNGRKLSSLEYCHELIKNGLNHITISIQGPNARIHDYLTRRIDSFKQNSLALKNLSYLKNKFPFTLITSTVLTKINYLLLKEMVEYLSQFPLDEKIFQIVECRGKKMGLGFRSLMPRYSEVAEEIKKIDKLLSGHKFCILGIPLCILRKEGKNFTLGYTETIKRPLLNQNTQEKLKLFDYSKEYSTIKRKKCQKCYFFHFCRGIFNPYIKNFGWEEFQPIIKY